MYIKVDGKLRKEVLDAKVVRGMVDGADNYALLTEIRIRDGWKYNWNGRVSEIAIEKMDRKEV